MEVKKYNIIYRDKADEDLFEYIDYIERMTFSKEKAEKLSSEIIAEILKLSLFPYLYQKIFKDFRSFSINNRRILYKVYEKKKIVVIYRILSWFQEYENYLK